MVCGKAERDGERKAKREGMTTGSEARYRGRRMKSRWEVKGGGGREVHRM